MNLQYKNENFLFRSEIAAKNDNFGFSLGTGLKGKFSEELGEFESLMIHYLTFFEKDENAGNVRGGYSGGGTEVPTTISSLHITSPDSDKTINKTFSKNSIKDTEAKELSYSGVGETGDSGSELINFSEETLGQLTYDDSDDNSSLNVVFPLQVSGYKDSGVFYEPNGSGSGAWKKYAIAAFPDTLTNIPPSVSAWTDFAKDKQGTWKSMTDYCQGKEILGDDEKSKSICYRQD